MTPRRLLPFLAAALLVAACAEQQPPAAPGEPRVEVLPMPEEVPVPEPGPLPEEMLELPMAPEEMSALANAVHERFGDSPELGTTEVSLDRTDVTVRWFGDPPAALRALLDSYRDAPFEIRLERTRYRQGDLMAEALRLLQEHPDVVTGSSPRTQGDGVNVYVDPEVIDSPDQADLESYGITSRFPLFPEAQGRPVPAVG